PIAAAAAPAPCIVRIRRHPAGMHLPVHESPPDAPAHGRADAARIWRAFNTSLAFVLAMLAMFSAQHYFDWRPLAVAPRTLEGLWGLLLAPLQDRSAAHVGAHAASVLIRVPLAGTGHPGATLRALPLP